ncbi:hypothetical protein W97_07477 [Coniosporium apollinis CBS 100218]|uniref:WD40 repeat-like protein n=1 Tax=Coniosporium apollinis (strain CBS 100218) TaxID=1168221 RepID=R7Z2G7_CONA1|nr:uncharacterized protein W97_07477 [Coniosporium apollinis CBS 100218]EON68219.1 hypothetical protein W97_07477 [Coniosporium apollinis CBS 100218]
MENVDPIQSSLNAVTKRLQKPHFLKNISASRLPSQATSEGPASPTELHPARSRNLAAPLSFDVNPKPAGSQRRRPVFTPATSVLTGDHYDGLGQPLLGGLPRSLDELESFFLCCCRAWTRMAAERGFQTFSHGHQDLVLAVDFNFYGTRMVTASSDHRLKVWDRKDDTWSLVDTWKGHDAEIVDVKWNGPFMGEVLGSIGEDGRFNLWEEDPTEPPNSGLRFKRIYSLPSETKVPFMSLDFKNIMHETYLALITRDGYLSVYEPVDQDSFSEWKAMVETYVCPTPSRQEETSFRVCFHREKLPCWKAIMAGLDRKALSLAVAAMDVVKIYRQDTKDRRFYEAVELKGARDLVRDVAWANGSMRGFDVVATASKDGAIRIYELHTPQPAQAAEAGESAPGSSSASEATVSPRVRAGKSAPSGIGAGLAGASRAKEGAQENEKNPGRIKHVVKLVAELTKHHGAVWRLSFSQMGDLLVSTGDDGTIKTWKRAVNNQWLEYAEIDASQEQ